MSIQGEIDRINNNVSDALAATAEMGASVPETANSNDLGRLIRSIPQSGGGTSINVTAEVGQTIIVKEVDANGKPTKWESADYQPRTHWTERVEVLPETTVELDTETGAGALVEAIELSVGKNYIVRWNGTEYNCTAQYYFAPIDEEGNTVNAGVIVGNVDMVLGGEGTGEPFAVANFLPEFVAEAGAPNAIVAFDGAESVTLSIGEEVYHTIPEQYLPQQKYIYEISKDEFEEITDTNGRLLHYSAQKAEIPTALLKAMLQSIPVYLKVSHPGPSNDITYTFNAPASYVATDLSGEILEALFGVGWEEQNAIPISGEANLLRLGLGAYAISAVNTFEHFCVRFVGEGAN